MTLPNSSDRPPAKDWTWPQRHSLLLVGLSPIVANLIGSVFNILYNQTQIQPLLSPAQMDRFHACWQVFNLFVYPVAIACYVVPLWRLRPLHRALLNQMPVDADRLAAGRRRVLHLPWWFLLVAAIGWLSCIPVFPLAIASAGEPLSGLVIGHLITSFVIASLIAVTQSFFAVELATQATLFPVFFQDANPASTPGAVPLSIRMRGILWAFSAVVCPVVSLVLLLIVPDAANLSPMFGVTVGVVAIAFGLITSWMLGRWVASPVTRLQRAASSVAGGNLDVRVNLLRSDDFGLLIERFNRMVEGLQHREKLQETFGRHVGREAARQIMSQSDGSSGREQNITVMFVDVRNFTRQSSNMPAAQVVDALNLFFETAVEIVERHGGMVNKFLGDGFMAIFGVGSQTESHGPRAVQAGCELACVVDSLQDRMLDAGWNEFAIGIGINTGIAVVGCIGSPKRQEYTAIGDTVNIASRVESLTKPLNRVLLITQSTRDSLPDSFEVQTLPDQTVKGKTTAVAVYAIILSTTTNASNCQTLPKQVPDRQPSLVQHSDDTTAETNADRVD
ncbi:adenylate/guanylate cyclase domain-containing protein [Rhodopirellula sp. JC740]|uniref:Adenylate/guanylate cyclase domain-containing protein n=1 Tax=Rhodopirellula halodulae TaxID=2894198 RepID=A0ABS8NCJ2_9BACT|nr:adenylate/guanylate cyclase domain-containing protein [Rhodopirellula sp. JC740]MCC9641270.1 adenylate/guanylate cyclase domain-containing protein [Rhodopirellula sp. JC740]